MEYKLARMRSRRVVIGYLGLHRRGWQSLLVFTCIKLVLSDYLSVCLLHAYPYLFLFQFYNHSHQYQINNTIANSTLLQTQHYCKLNTIELSQLLLRSRPTSLKTLRSCYTWESCGDHGPCENVVYLAALPPSRSTARAPTNHF